MEEVLQEEIMGRGRALAWNRGPRARSPSTNSPPQGPLPGVAPLKTEAALLPWSWEGHGEQAVCMAGVPSQSFNERAHL